MFISGQSSPFESVSDRGNTAKDGESCTSCDHQLIPSMRSARTSCVCLSLHTLIQDSLSQWPEKPSDLGAVVLLRWIVSGIYILAYVSRFVGGRGKAIYVFNNFENLERRCFLTAAWTFSVFLHSCYKNNHIKPAIPLRDTVKCISSPFHLRTLRFSWGLDRMQPVHKHWPLFIYLHIRKPLKHHFREKTIFAFIRCQLLEV